MSPGRCKHCGQWDEEWEEGISVCYSPPCHDRSLAKLASALEFLRECRRSHHNSPSLYASCPIELGEADTLRLHREYICTCGATEFNARLDALLREISE
jgi:hypothetical protein